MSFREQMEGLKRPREHEVGESLEMQEVKNLEHALEIIAAARVEVFENNPAVWKKLCKVTEHLRKQLSEQTEKIIGDPGTEK